MESTWVLQEPLTTPRLARCLIRPSLPTTFPMRTNSCVLLSSTSATSLKASAMAPAMPGWSEGSRALKSPFLRALKAVNSWLVSMAPLTECVLAMECPLQRMSDGLSACSRTGNARRASVRPWVRWSVEGAGVSVAESAEDEQI